MAARAVGLATLVATLLAVTALPAAAQGGCGGVHTVVPKTGHGAPLAIGDSTMLLALPDLQRRGFAANAHGCRQWPEALTLLRSLRRDGRLPQLVVVALGADGIVQMSYIKSALGILGRQRRLVLVTPIELGGGSGSDAEVVRRSAGVYPGRINVLDWVRYARGKGSWFQPDGVHLTFPGAAEFARFLVRARSLADRTPTVFGDVIFTKPGAAVRLPATVRLDAPAGWVVTARRSPTGLPALTVRRRGRCALTGELRSRRLRLREGGGPVTVAAAARPAGAAELGRIVNRGERTAAVWWRATDRSVAGTWVSGLGDPFPDDEDHGERGFLRLDLTITASRPPASGCGIATAEQILKRLHRLAV